MCIIQTCFVSSITREKSSLKTCVGPVMPSELIRLCSYIILTLLFAACSTLVLLMVLKWRGSASEVPLIKGTIWQVIRHLPGYFCPFSNTSHICSCPPQPVAMAVFVLLRLEWAAVSAQSLSPRVSQAALLGKIKLSFKPVLVRFKGNENCQV